MNKTGSECNISDTQINNSIITARLLSSHNISRKELEFCITFFDPVYPESTKRDQLCLSTSETR